MEITQLKRSYRSTCYKLEEVIHTLSARREKESEREKERVKERERERTC